MGAELVAQGAELLLFLVSQAGSHLAGFPVASGFHIGNGLPAPVGQVNPLHAAVVLVHGAGDESVRFRAGQDLAEGGGTDSAWRGPASGRPG